MNSALSNLSPRPRCECHECTQARYAMMLKDDFEAGLPQAECVPEKNQTQAGLCGQAGTNAANQAWSSQNFR